MSDKAYSLAQLSDVFAGAQVEQRGHMTVVTVDEYSLQEEFIRHVQMGAGLGSARYVRRGQTLSAAATPFIEFGFTLESLNTSRVNDAKNLGWVLGNLLAEKPYIFEHAAA